MHIGSPRHRDNAKVSLIALVMSVADRRLTERELQLAEEVIDWAVKAAGEKERVDGKG